MPGLWQDVAWIPLFLFSYTIMALPWIFEGAPEKTDVHGKADV